MLGPLDDTLWHQLPTTFDHVGTSDPRFFDRYWFAVTEPGGLADPAVHARRLQQHGRRRRRLRRRPRRARSATSASRARCGRASSRRADRCASRCSSRCSGSACVAEPGTTRSTASWSGPACSRRRRSAPHFSRVRGRVSEEYQRFNQIGECSRLARRRGPPRRPSTGGGDVATIRGGSGRTMGIPEPVTAAPPASPERPGSCSRSSSSRPTPSPVTCRSPSAATQRAYLTGLFRDRRAPELARPPRRRRGPAGRDGRRHPPLPHRHRRRPPRRRTPASTLRARRARTVARDDRARLQRRLRRRARPRGVARRRPRRVRRVGRARSRGRRPRRRFGQPARAPHPAGPRHRRPVPTSTARAPAA